MQHLQTKVEVLQLEQFKSITKYIELIGRVCYNSEDKITKNSHIKFSKFLLTNKHLSVFEHAVFVFKGEFPHIESKIVDGILINPDKFINRTKDYFSLNLRTAIELYLHYQTEDVLKLIRTIVYYHPDLLEIFPVTRMQYYTKLSNSEIKELPYEERLIHQHITFRIETNTGVTHELVRHRLCSFTQASTRYIDYSELLLCTSLIPEYELSLFVAIEDIYKYLKNKYDKQTARNVLPKCLYTTLYMTAPLYEWNHILSLRLDKTAHPEIQDVARHIGQLLTEYNYI